MIASALQFIAPAAAFCAGVLASAVFAGMETGIYVLNKVRLELRTARDDHAAKRLSRALGRPQEMLGALLIANNASLYLVTALTVVLFTRAGSGNPHLYTMMVVTPLLFVLGEMLPKNLFRVAGETLTYRLSWLLAGLMFVCRWLGLTLLITGLSRVILAMMPGRPVGVSVTYLQRGLFIDHGRMLLIVGDKLPESIIHHFDITCNIAAIDRGIIVAGGLLGQAAAFEFGLDPRPVHLGARANRLGRSRRHT